MTVGVRCPAAAAAATAGGRDVGAVLPDRGSAAAAASVKGRAGAGARRDPAAAAERRDGIVSQAARTDAAATNCDVMAGMMASVRR